MKRREYVGACFTLGAATAVAGCTDSGLVETREIPSTPPILSDRPDAVYFPTHVDGMEMAGMAESADGEYAFALMYTYPHRFWRVGATTESPEDATINDVDGSQDVHLMAVVWDPETGQVLPETGMSVDIERDGKRLDEQVIYPMISPRMGFHYGANFQLGGDGTYDVTLSVGGTNVRRTGAYDGRFDDPASVTLPFEFSAEARNDIDFERTPDRAGDPAVPPVMEMNHPLGVAPSADELPGENRRTAESGDMQLVITALSNPPAGISTDGTYLAVSARTPYNELLLPAMALDATLDRDGETVFDGGLERTFDDELDYHYGAVVDDVRAGDELRIEIHTHPQVARHEGYESAFLRLPAVELTL